MPIIKRRPLNSYRPKDDNESKKGPSLEMIQQLQLFLHSNTFLDLYQKFNIIGFWVSLPLIFLLTFIVVHLQKKYDAKKNEIKKTMYSPGMEDTRWLMKDRLKKHGIKPDDSWHKRN